MRAHVYLEHLGNVASTKYSMNISESLRIGGRKIWQKYAIRGAPSSQLLASCTSTVATRVHDYPFSYISIQNPMKIYDPQRYDSMNLRVLKNKSFEIFVVSLLIFLSVYVYIYLGRVFRWQL